MIIWVDADACPKVIKEILFRTADRREVQVTLVANQVMRVPKSDFVDSILVEAGFDVADHEIVRRMQPHDLVITADIPLAADVIEKGGVAINPRGELYDKENVKQSLRMRNLMDELRGVGLVTGGPAAFNQRDRQAFANQLDRLLTRQLKNKV
ncbi:MAG: YaiI/YqxD family protein [Mariprofundaceae bacterium]